MIMAFSIFLNSACKNSDQTSGVSPSRQSHHLENSGSREISGVPYGREPAYEIRGYAMFMDKATNQILGDKMFSGMCRNSNKRLTIKFKAFSEQVVELQSRND